VFDSTAMWRAPIPSSLFYIGVLYRGFCIGVWIGLNLTAPLMAT
jgi:hypothetical protein